MKITLSLSYKLTFMPSATSFDKLDEKFFHVLYFEIMPLHFTQESGGLKSRSSVDPLCLSALSTLHTMNI